MAFTASKLNNIAGSMGLANLWIYTDSDTDPSSMDAANYFAGANKYGMSVGDVIILSGSSGEVIMGSVTAISDSASTIAAFTAVGS